MEKDPLTPKQRLFVTEYCKDFNATQAAIRAGYSEASAGSIATENLQKPLIAQEIAKFREERALESKFGAQDVFQALVDMATADPNELVEYRRTCCRFCWGVGFKYQRTVGEMERDRAAHDLVQAEAQDKGDATVPQFNTLGGDGFDATRDPHPECPECHSEGVGDVFVKDTRQLSRGALALYAGVKRTKDGIEVKMHPKDKALELLGRHLGMFHDKLELTAKVEVVSRIAQARRRGRG